LIPAARRTHRRAAVAARQAPERRELTAVVVPLNRTRHIDPPTHRVSLIAEPLRRGGSDALCFCWTDAEDIPQPHAQVLIEPSAGLLLTAGVDGRVDDRDDLGSAAAPAAEAIEMRVGVGATRAGARGAIESGLRPVLSAATFGRNDIGIGQRVACWGTRGQRENQRRSAQRRALGHEPIPPSRSGRSPTQRSGSAL
jgi:hypothetical protein